MSHQNTAFHQLLKPLSGHDFEGLAKQHHSGQKLRSVSRWDQFIGMAMSLLSGRQSLRNIQSKLEAQQHKLFHLGAKPIACSTLARRNEKQPAEFYAALFYRLLNRCKEQPSQHKFHFKNPLCSLDASAIDLSIKLVPWAEYMPGTAKVKLSVGLSHGTLIPAFVALSDGNENDMVRGRAFTCPKAVLWPLIKAASSTSGSLAPTKQQVSFVTRLRPNAVYAVLERRPVNKAMGVTSNQVIQFNSAHAVKRGAPQLRRIDFRDK